ncbi:MAG: PKD domain-containing protein, partial [Candidatus Thermoplasmatota archaeon]|nr:PKD domain-containing protein [Candidatus Thermoplasmatota archaeon]
MWIQEWLNPNKPPVAMISANPTSGKAPLEVFFDASNSYDADGDEIATYQWNFGDGGAGEGKTVAHGYGNPGEYLVRLTIIDERGAEGTVEFSILVYEPSVIITEHEFDAQAGTQFNTGTGLTISIPGGAISGQARLSVATDQSVETSSAGGIQTLVTYYIDLETTLQMTSHIWQMNSTLPFVAKLIFSIPPSVNPEAVFILKWTEDGWSLASSANEGEPLGGKLSPDRTSISISVSSFSTFSLGALLEPIQISPVYPEFAEEETAYGEGWIKKIVHIRTPERKWPYIDVGVGGLWFSVELRNFVNLDSSGWEPPYSFNLGLINVIDDIEKRVNPNAPPAWYLEPTGPVKCGTLTLMFDGRGGEAEVHLDTCLWLQILSWLLEGVPFGDLSEEVLKQLIAVTQEFVNQVRARFEGQAPSWDQVLREVATALEQLAGKLARLGLENMPGRLGRIAKKIIVRVDLIFVAGNVGVYLTTLCCQNAGACSHGHCMWEVVAVPKQNPPNQPPTITSLEADPGTVHLGGQSRISLSAHDPENDPLTFSWSCSGGTLSGNSGPEDKIWTAPNATGTYRITVSVTDNQPGRSPVNRSVDVTVASAPTPVTGEITATSVSPSPAQVGQQVTFQCTVKNTGTTRHTFEVGLSVWKVGSPISTAIIDTSKQVTLDPDQQQTVTLSTYSFSSSQTGDWNYQFGLWKDSAGGTLLDRKPSPAGVLTVTSAPTPVQVPTVETRAATDVTTTAATIHGAVTNDGGASIVERRFDWGTTASCSDGWTDQVTVSGNSFSFRLTGLQAGTTYYFRAWAKNSAGWSDVSSTLYFQTSTSPTSTVTLTLYVHEGSETGPVISGARVQGHDAAGNSFDKTTTSSGYVTIT